MPMKGTTKGADLYKEMKKMMQSLDIPTQWPAGLVKDEHQVCLEGTVACLCLSPVT
jgi:hypothetical protein